MAAHEKQNQRVVRIHVRLDVNGGRDGLRFFGHGGFPLAASNFAAHLVGHAPRRDLNQPAAWVVGNAFARPLRESSNHGFLNRVLRGREVVKAASHHTEHLRSEFAQQVLRSCVPGLSHLSSRYSISGGGALITGRTSIGMFNGAPPGPGAADTLAAIAYARSGLSTSTIQKPARNSLDSGNTPSVMGIPPFPALTSLA